MKFKPQRSFGLVIFAVITATGVWLAMTQNPFAPLCFAVAGVLMLLTLFAPLTLSHPARLWAKLGLLLERINSYLILGLLFFLLLTPVGLIARAFGHDPLRLKNKHSGSYWQVRDQSWENESFKDQF